MELIKDETYSPKREKETKGNKFQVFWKDDGVDSQNCEADENEVKLNICNCKGERYGEYKPQLSWWKDMITGDKDDL